MSNDFDAFLKDRRISKFVKTGESIAQHKKSNSVDNTS